MTLQTDKNRLTFQQIIMRLNEFWAGQGCLMWYPYSEKVGAGTMNPASVLGVLGPEPWKVGYIEPSYRPDDGRFGENPNRMQMHTQYQVILKPDPGDPQGTYLRSLEALGIDTTKHDVRFVEDNWESPALGAWGLGWEVWLDGLEITQFTYFQQSASHVLELPAIEITYGLERLAMFIQGVRKVWDLAWDANHTYGAMLLGPEIEHCRYDFETADIDRLLRMYQLFEDEAQSAIGAGLTTPAHDYVLRCSHVFNVLDARGAIGVTERAAYFGRMRDLSRRVADLYLKGREAAGFPWLRLLPTTSVADLPPAGPPQELPADFVLELGTEELPPDDLRSAIEQWQRGVPALLDELRLGHGPVKVTATPRRLVALVNNLAGAQAPRTTEVKGPSVKQAFGADKQPTPAGLGFARAQGVTAQDLQVRTIDGKEVVVAVRVESCRGASEVLSEALPKLVGGLRFGKSMRWDGTAINFSRPIRWLLALHGDRVVPFQYGPLVSERTTRGPRHISAAEPVIVPNAAAYPSVLESHQVMVDREDRKRAVREQVLALAEEVGGVVPENPQLLEEVTDLVEWPVAVRGGFDAEYLQLPREVLTTVMKKHQRYFPVLSAGDQLLPHFITIVNGKGRDVDLVRQGNEDVLRARYADAHYFVKQDRKHPLAGFVPRLARLVFHDKLGSVLDKQTRVGRLMGGLAELLKLSPEERGWATRAAELCKADLATGMVVEMTSLQGFMGREYARSSGEPEEVAEAIFEHYLPRFAGDALPTTAVGVAVGLADRFDSLAGLFGIGLRPVGSADPFGIRRIALGLIQIAVERQISLSLRQHLEAAAAVQPVAVTDAARKDAWAFLVDRLQARLRDQGRRADIVAAVLDAQGDNPFDATLACVRLDEAVRTPDWSDVLTAYARCKRIVRDLKGTLPVDPTRYTEPAARGLYDSFINGNDRLQNSPNITTLLTVLRELVSPINLFFRDLMVMDKDTSIRQARLALIQRVADLAAPYADLSRLQGF